MLQYLILLYIYIDIYNTLNIPIHVYVCKDVLFLYSYCTYSYIMLCI